MIQSKNGKHPIPSEEELKREVYKLVEARAAWLNKVMEMILPKKVFERAQYPNFQKFVQTYLKNVGITIATDGEKMAVLRDGKVFASWEPGQKEVE